MKRSPLVATLLSCSFSLQLALAVVGVTCVTPSGGAAHAASVGMSGIDMAGMEMAGMNMADMPADEGTLPSSDGHGPDGVPCDQPGTPDTCQVMAPCAGGFVVIAASRLAPAADVPATVLAMSVATPQSRTIPPELPPPRA